MIKFYALFLSILLNTILLTNTALSGDAKYIDFMSGNDQNPGTKRTTMATSSMGQRSEWQSLCSIKRNYLFFFKNGVVYYGELIANNSGTPEKPVLLTTDKKLGPKVKLVISAGKKNKRSLAEMQTGRIQRTSWKRCR